MRIRKQRLEFHFLRLFFSVESFPRGRKFEQQFTTTDFDASARVERPLGQSNVDVQTGKFVWFGRTFIIVAAVALVELAEQSAGGDRGNRIGHSAQRNAQFQHAQTRSLRQTFDPGRSVVLGERTADETAATHDGQNLEERSAGNFQTHSNVHGR